MQYHPDRNPGDASAEERFKELSEAYALLRDPDARRNYDTYGRSDPRNYQRPDTSSVDWHTIFREADINIDWGARGSVPATGNAVFDMLFGTFRNPKDFAAETGFRPGDSARLPEMLLCRDIAKEDVASHAGAAVNQQLPAMVIAIAATLLTQQVQAQESLNRNFGIGGQVGQYQQDFGIGLHVTSPYFANGKTAVRLKGNLVWNEHLNSISETTWSSYSNLALGLVQSVGELNGIVRLYGESGAILLFPSDAFSSKPVQFGGYGLFGFEFLLDRHISYFLEAGGVGTGARADKVAGVPIYSNGFQIHVGVRAQF